MLNRWQWAIVFVLGVPVVSLILLVLASSDLAFAWQYTPWLFISKCCAVIGASLFALNFVFSSRADLVEKWFGGLDNVYRLHRWTGYTAWGFLLGHATFMLIHIWPYPTLLTQILVPGRYWPYNFGVIALTVMDIIIIATFIKQIPYRWWRSTHTFMSIVLLIALLHVSLVPSDVQRFMPLRIWMLSWFAIAVLSYLHRKVWYPYFGPKYEYRIHKIKPLINVLDVYLKPQGDNRLFFHPGQFVFIDLPDNPHVPGEDHPFSIVSLPNDTFVRLGIKQVGDYTTQLAQVKQGTSVIVRGPYGHFAEKLLVTNKDAVWIAGGIGVTPFLSMLAWERQQKSTRKVWFFYSCSTSQELVYDQEIKNTINSEMPRIIYSPWYSQSQGRITAFDIQQRVGSFKKKLIFLCGPSPMMYGLAKQLKELGVRNSQIIFEDFSFK